MPTFSQQQENLGFIFTGFLPASSSGDMLTMQFFNDVVNDYHAITGICR